ncbi:apoptosis-associated speck-like protein containing a CARD isoform X2 [Notothenia coriiceps]|uniref:Apoptosis-associated speck-like protein containing a CARD isoform X2 n=1 Tax=Notothenia coriiceps TaxID=8208 RepID=A0A6I9NGN7_9TELE|nr:PREDICTED: apoptosis-associated speck-like protein containing a CARD isoform X2 [Notothenia coriiceps]
MDKQKAVKRMLKNLSKENFTNFCHELMTRKKEPRVARNRVEGKSDLDILDVLISTFDETGAVEVAAELLNEINCKNEADQLLKDTGVKYSEPGSSNMVATGGPSSAAGPLAGGTAAQYTMVDGEHFVDKHRTELINRVNCVADILDQLHQEKVITQSSYSDIMVIPTSQKKMRELFSGPLNAAGLRGKDVFYRILEKEEKYLIEELKGNK